MASDEKASADDAKKIRPTFRLPLRPGYARALTSAGGRTGELRQGERARGDKGGREREDGIPDVPHGGDGTKR